MWPAKKYKIPSKKKFLKKSPEAIVNSRLGQNHGKNLNRGLNLKGTRAGDVSVVIAIKKSKIEKKPCDKQNLFIKKKSGFSL